MKCITHLLTLFMILPAGSSNDLVRESPLAAVQYHFPGVQERLQSVPESTRQLQQDPSMICEAYNNETDSLECECSRFNRNEVLVNCTYIEDQCNDDGSYCYAGSFEIVLDDTSLATVVTSCINNTVASTPEYTCVRSFPMEPGNYTTIKSCSAQFNGEVCNFCDPCTATVDEESGELSTDTTVTLNCCNVQADTKATCNKVSPNGAIIPFFDLVAEGDIGKCKGVMSPSSDATNHHAAKGWILFRLGAFLMAGVVGFVFDSF